MDKGLETFAGVRGDNVSGGQAQRICIARAVATDAPNLILDEATSALDIGTSSKLIEALMDWWQERQQQGYRQTLISIAHRKEALDFCDKIYHLDGGCLCPPEKYTTTSRVYLAQFLKFFRAWKLMF